MITKQKNLETYLNVVYCFENTCHTIGISFFIFQYKISILRAAGFMELYWNKYTKHLTLLFEKSII